MTTTRTKTARRTDVRSTYRADCIVIDMDGTLTPDPHSPWRYDPARIDTALIRECQAAGYAVAISTCGVVPQIAEALTEAGIRCWADHRMERWSWHDADVVLVSNRKISGRVFLDDHAMHWTYGDDITRLWQRIEADKGYRWCPGPARHHWGVSGAAGILPWCRVQDTTYVALGLRSAAVHGGECWSTAGGAIEAGESAMDAALREAHEEIHGLGKITPGEPYIAPCEAGCGWAYHTYAAGLASASGTLPRITVRKGRHQWETLRVAWFPVDAIPAELHPGFAAAWPELRARIGA